MSHVLRRSHHCSGVALLLGICVGCAKPSPSVPAGPPSAIGTITLQVAGNATAAGPRIALPDIDVVLRDSANADVAKTRSQLDGRFRLRAPGAGTYTVCWTAVGFGAGCGAKFVTSGADVFLGPVLINAEPGVIFGKVLTSDAPARACWVNDPFFALDVSTRVTLFDSARATLQTRRANILGEYAIGGVPPRRRYTVQAECERSIERAAVPASGTAVLVNLTLRNHAPSIAALSAVEGGRGITGALGGATIQVTAITRDADQDPVEYLWRAADGFAGPPFANVRQQTLTLPASAGLHTLYLIARDGKGGYAFKRFDLPVGATSVGMSGRVIDETTKLPVPNASVDVNGVTATTNTWGWFTATVPPSPAPARYVVNIHHPQYALLSRIHDRAGAGNTYALIRAQTSTHDATRGIDVTDTSSSGPCGSPREKAAPGGVRPAGISDSGVRGQPDRTAISKPCIHRGARIVLPAGALVDATQAPALGQVTLAMATLNPSRRALPGDYRAVDKNNAPAEMLSFGAVYAQFRDAGGRALNLKAGTTAEVRVPVSAEQLSSAQPTIALWAYDEATGMWKEEGQAALQNTPQGPMYVGTTTHFSTLNMDVAGSDPAQATCVRFELGASLAGWTNLYLRAYVSYAGTSVQVKETALDGAQYHAIYRIPYAPPAPPPNTLRLELRGTYNGQEVVLLNNVIATDAPRAKMAGTNLWPPYDYAECGDPVVLEADPVTLPYYGVNDATGRPFFLTGPYGEFLPLNADQEATDYYATIDPTNANPTLSAWWTNHGFAADGGGGTRAAYLNFNDLGFGRDMNCKTSGGDLACYVTNYGAPDQNLGNADAAQNKDASKRLATVAMEYKASEPADRRVRFYVYGGGDPTTAGKLKFADLDGMGPKPVPHLCTVCHGGDYRAAVKNALQSRFREFDLPSFKYSGGRSWDYPSGATILTPAEFTAFAGLNQMVRDVTPAGSPIQNLINNWYPGGFSGAPVKPAVPAGWVGHEAGYHDVYGKSCRTCHVARDNGVANSFITFSTFTNYSGTSYAVCDAPKFMPNAYVTYKNFWSDLQRVIDYRALTGVNATTCH